MCLEFTFFFLKRQSSGVGHFKVVVSRGCFKRQVNGVSHFKRPRSGFGVFMKLVGGVGCFCKTQSSGVGHFKRPRTGAGLFKRLSDGVSSFKR